MLVETEEAVAVVSKLTAFGAQNQAFRLYLSPFESKKIDDIDRAVVVQTQKPDECFADQKNFLILCFGIHPQSSQ